MGKKLTKITIQIRRGTTEEWNACGSVVPAEGEPCLDLTTGHLKFGDGVTQYKDLPDIASIFDQALIDAANEHRTDLQAMVERLGAIESNVNGIKELVGTIPADSDAANLIAYIEAHVCHEHTNKDVLDGITQDRVERWEEDRVSVLPEITQEDDGKFICVENGAFALCAVADVSKEGM